MFGSVRSVTLRMCACRRDWGYAPSNRCLEGSGRAFRLSARIGRAPKAAYRFFSNERVSEEEILRGHFRSTQERLALESDPILILHDTTEFSYHAGGDGLYWGSQSHAHRAL